MDVVAGTWTVLFQSEEDEEYLCIRGTVSPEGGLLIQQVSAGDLTAWCFEESPHKVGVVIAPVAVTTLLEYLHAEDAQELLKLLATIYCGYDASLRIRNLMRRLSVPYEVIERPIMR